MTRRHRVPVIHDKRNKTDIAKYKKHVRKYCATEFAKGRSPELVTKRLLKVGGIPVVSKWVRAEYLRYNGVGPSVIWCCRLSAILIAFGAAFALLSPTTKSQPTTLIEAAFIGVLGSIALEYVFKAIVKVARSPKTARNDADEEESESAEAY